MEKKIEPKISCPKLAEFIRNNLRYFFVRNNAKSGILRYVYLEGYYKLVSDEEFEGIIKAFIPSNLQKFNLIYTNRQVKYWPEHNKLWKWYFRC